MPAVYIRLAIFSFTPDGIQLVAINKLPVILIFEINRQLPELDP